MTNYTPETSDLRSGRSTHSTALNSTESPFSGWKTPNHLKGKRQEQEDYGKINTQTTFCEYMIESDRSKMKAFAVSTGSKESGNGELPPEKPCGCKQIADYVLSLKPSPDNPVKITMTTYRRGTGLMRLGKKTRVQPPLISIFFFEGRPEDQEPTEYQMMLSEETREHQIQEEKTDRILRMLRQNCQQTLIGFLFGMHTTSIKHIRQKHGIEFQTQSERTGANAETHCQTRYGCRMKDP